MPPALPRLAARGLTIHHVDARIRRQPDLLIAVIQALAIVPGDPLSVLYVICFVSAFLPIHFSVVKCEEISHAQVTN